MINQEQRQRATSIGRFDTMGGLLRSNLGTEIQGSLTGLESPGTKVGSFGMQFIHSDLETSGKITHLITSQIPGKLTSSHQIDSIGSKQINKSGGTSGLMFSNAISGSQTNTPRHLEGSKIQKMSDVQGFLMSGLNHSGNISGNHLVASDQLPSQSKNGESFNQRKMTSGQKYDTMKHQRLSEINRVLRENKYIVSSMEDTLHLSGTNAKNSPVINQSKGFFVPKKIISQNLNTSKGHSRNFSMAKDQDQIRRGNTQNSDFYWKEVGQNLNLVQNQEGRTASPVKFVNHSFHKEKVSGFDSGHRKYINDTSRSHQIIQKSPSQQLSQMIKNNSINIQQIQTNTTRNGDQSGNTRILTSKSPIYREDLGERSDSGFQGGNTQSYTLDHRNQNQSSTITQNSQNHLLGWEQPSTNHLDRQSNNHHSNLANGQTLTTGVKVIRKQITYPHQTNNKLPTLQNQGIPLAGSFGNTNQNIGESNRFVINSSNHRSQALGGRQRHINPLRSFGNSKEPHSIEQNIENITHLPKKVDTPENSREFYSHIVSNDNMTRNFDEYCSQLEGDSKNYLQSQTSEGKFISLINKTNSGQNSLNHSRNYQHKSGSKLFVNPNQFNKEPKHSQIQQNLNYQNDPLIYSSFKAQNQNVNNSNLRNQNRSLGRSGLVTEPVNRRQQTEFKHGLMSSGNFRVSSGLQSQHSGSQIQYLGQSQPQGGEVRRLGGRGDSLGTSGLGRFEREESEVYNSVLLSG